MQASTMLDEASSNSSRQPNGNPVLGLHRGALDKEMVTSSIPPIKVMGRVDKALQGMGIQVDKESTYKYQCIRPKLVAAVAEGGDKGGPSPTAGVLYSATEGDMCDEVGFSLELTSLPNLSGTYTLDMRRMKGNLRSYKYLYETLRDRVALESSENDFWR